MSLAMEHTAQSKTYSKTSYHEQSRKFKGDNYAVTLHFEKKNRKYSASTPFSPDPTYSHMTKI